MAYTINLGQKLSVRRNLILDRAKKVLKCKPNKYETLDNLWVDLYPNAKCGGIEYMLLVAALEYGVTVRALKYHDLYDNPAYELR
ncbi:MAG: hypothetical protein V4519_02905 [Patescibacteria group bacterium]